MKKNIFNRVTGELSLTYVIAMIIGFMIASLAWAILSNDFTFDIFRDAMLFSGGVIIAYIVSTQHYSDNRKKKKK